MTRLTFFMGLCLLAGCGDSTGATGGAGGGGVGGLGGTSGTGGAGGIDLNVWPCTEQGIRDAITIGGGPHTFACDAPTIVTTQATLDVDNNVILDGEGNLIVDGGDDHTVFSLLRAGRAVFRNMTIQRGYTEGAGAGIRSFESDLIVEGCTIVDNRSLEQIGGGIYSFDGVLEIVGSTISRNEAVIGGGITCGACDLEVRQSFITDNMGGGIDNLGTTFVLDTTITGNVSSFGGGGIANSGELVLVDSVISANEGARGGGVFNAGTMSVFGTTIDGNNAEEGGGVYAFDASRNGGDLWLSNLVLLEVAGSTISNNTAQRGAGIYSIALRTSAWNSTFSGNAASEEGGAFYLGGTTLGASTIYLTHNTVADNTAPLGSALVASGETPTLRLAGNVFSGECVAQGDAVAFESRGYNVESPGDSCGLTELSDEPNTTSEQLALGPLHDNGGDTNTHLPGAESIAIDLIPLEERANVFPIEPALDQRVVDRPQGAGCDAGSVEVVPEP
ncbi:MAG: right-handed parallel beta-helix repeat-containing protein [Polyangiales bacterium]